MTHPQEQDTAARVAEELATPRLWWHKDDVAKLVEAVRADERQCLNELLRAERAIVRRDERAKCRAIVVANVRQGEQVFALAAIDGRNEE